MSSTALPIARPCDGWLRFPISDDRVTLTTSIDIEKELWSALEYYSEVEEVGKSLIQAKGFPQPQDQEIFRYLQAFVRQAKSYYSSAKLLHYRSSSLLYYYSFLNLVKAYILLKDPNRMVGRTAHAVVHGLSYRSSTNNTDFLHEAIRVAEGIFPTFYEMQTGTTISTTQRSTLNIISLFSYCSDMQHQYVSAGYGSTKLLPSVATIVTDRSVNQAWSVIGIPAVNDLNAFLSAQRNFLRTYQEVSVDKDQLFFSFRMSAAELMAFRFFQDITPVSMITDGIAPLTHFNKLRNALTPYFSVHYFDDNRDFDLALPYQDSNMMTPIPMTEAVSIYAIMFYLSSLVRYRPDYLESLLNYKPAWLIESFVNCTPETFLRIMVCKIIEKDYVFRQR